MTRTRKRHLRTLLAVWLVVFGLTTQLQGGFSSTAVGQNLFLTFVVVLAIHGVNLQLVPRLRRTPLLVGVLLSGLAYFGAFLVSVLLCVWILIAWHDRSFASPAMRMNVERLFGTPEGKRGLASGYLLILATTFGVELSRRVGTRRLLAWLSGRYRNPKEERRVFLIIDLSGSTPLAETMGAVRFSALLRDFFHDLTEPTDETGGEIVSYVGDEAILSWSEKRGLEDGAALRCFLLFRAQVQRHSERYQRAYGTVPRYKAALHVGLVVATEVGERRSEVVLHGAALNTAARILGECNALGADLLMSEDVANRLPAVEGVVREPVGAIPLRGKAEPLGLVKVTFSP